MQLLKLKQYHKEDFRQLYELVLFSHIVKINNSRWNAVKEH